ncbi:hypothetical protein AAG570_002092 [Ranatra chinensis]|uniref:Peptidase A2 domain-containing protein n=1 Tax=Ranatra chinensis TaxID=642074 RepID=A0ABD0YCB6_9HEMI
MQGKAVVGKRGGGSEVKKQSPARVIPVVTRTSPAEWQAWLGIVKERFTRPRAEGVLDSRKGDRRPHLVVNVYGQPLLGLLDSGASRTLVGGEGWRVLRGLGLRDYGGGATHVTVADGSRCVVHGCVDLPFETTPLILGTDFWRAMAIVPNLSQGSWEFQDHAGEVVVSDGTGLEDHLEATQRETLDGVVREFVGRVGTPLGCTHRVQHVVDTGDSKPIKQRYYPFSPVLERAMHAELDEVQDRLTRAYERNRRHYDLRRRPVELAEGDVVWRKAHAQSDASRHYSAKLAPRYVLCRVKRKISPLVYVLEGDDGRDQGRWHIKDLKLDPREDTVA